MQIDRKQVEYVAGLSRLNMTPEELDRLVEQLSDIVTYFDKLNELDTDDVEPLTNPSGLANVFRADVSRPSLPREQALANSPEQTRGQYRVPQVIE